MTQRPRLDELLVTRGLAADIHEARALVMAGEVVVGQHRETAAGLRLCPDAELRVKRSREKRHLGYVSRGGAKLAHALDEFGLEVAGASCADLGCSTGGFTDCLLGRGAAHVSAVDVGRADFDWRLRNDARVSLHERTNVRGADVAAIGGPFDVVACDLSFISLARVAHDVYRMLCDGGAFVPLVKPQFEAGRDDVHDGGIVDAPETHVRVLRDVFAALRRCGFSVRALCYSPVRGARGNIEFLLLATKGQRSGPWPDELADGCIADVVGRAHDELGECA